MNCEKCGDDPQNGDLVDESINITLTPLMTPLRVIARRPFYVGNDGHNSVMM